MNDRNDRSVYVCLFSAEMHAFAVTVLSEFDFVSLAFECEDYLDFD